MQKTKRCWILETSASAPGPDGIPYAAWRRLPSQTANLLQIKFEEILCNHAKPPLQVGVWIPRAKMGPAADYFRPVGMPDTLERLLDGTVAGLLFQHTSQ